MKNLIRGHIYQLKKDNFFFGCLAFSLAFLFMSIRFLSPGPETGAVPGTESLISTFMGGDIVLYAFMLLTTNMIAEAYRSGVMKNIIGRGYPEGAVLSLDCFRNICCIFAGNADQQYRYGRYCKQQIRHGDSPLSWLLCAFRSSTHPLCNGIHQLCGYNGNFHQERNYRRYFGPCDSQYPADCGNGSELFEDSYQP